MGAVALIAVMAVSVFLSRDPVPQGATTGAMDATVAYVVTANTPAHVYYGSSSAMRSQDITENWSTDLMVPAGERLTLTVNSSDFANSDAEVTCEIIVDGLSRSKDNGNGEGALANCVFEPTAVD